MNLISLYAEKMRGQIIMYKCTKQNKLFFVSKRKSIEKETPEIFCCTR